MKNNQHVIAAIHSAFGENDYPGDHFLQGSFEGSEPCEDIQAFKGETDWRNIPTQLLDTHYTALNFFSEAGLRFFLPAYLIADLKEELQSADPLFVLVHGFSDQSVEHRIGDRVFVRKIGKHALVNPRRYGAMTFYDYARYRLSIFTRQEAQAIVAYLRYKKESDPYRLMADQIDAALNTFWLPRAENAPTVDDIQQHLDEDEQ